MTINKFLLMAFVALGGGASAAMAQGSGDDGRSISLTPYLWGTSIDGTATIGSLPPADLDASFGDILSNANFAMSLHTEFRFDNWVYRVHENWEVFGGLRYNDQDISMSGLPSPPLPVTSAGVSVSWTDGFIGARYKNDLGEKWYLTGRADVVVAGDSESTWNASIMFNRRFSKGRSLNIGYRYMDIDFDDSGVYGWDVVQNGPVIGYTWTF